MPAYFTTNPRVSPVQICEQELKPNLATYRRFPREIRDNSHLEKNRGSDWHILRQMLDILR